MNFKPTKLKIIGCVVIGLILVILLTIFIDQNCLPKMGTSCPIFSEETFYVTLVYFLIPIIGVLYVVWSLIQKK